MMCRTFIAALALVAFFALTAAADKPATLDTDPNLAARWTFDETSGEMAADTSGHKRNGTLKGGLSFAKNSVAGRRGKALEFDGEDSMIEVDKYKGVTGIRPRTVAAWMKTGRARGQIVSWGAEDFGQMFNFGFVRGRVGVTPHGGYLYMNEETHNDEWHHVGAVVTEAELPNLYDDVKLYLDGAPAEIHDIGLLDLWPLQTGSEFNVRIGRGFQGAIDDLRIYDRPLSDDEMKALFEGKTDQPLPKSK
ncbi:MAG: LamG domain-containing protein [Sedimentisphaerales bacterium]|nr:LamG domain-containing protein [Sedimentisphaerales bacterium]